MKNLKLIALFLPLLSLGCSQIHMVRTLPEAARHAEDPANLKDDFHVELSSTELAKMRKVAWIGFTLTSDDGEFGGADEIVENAFQVVDHELRRTLSPRSLEKTSTRSSTRLIRA